MSVTQSLRFCVSYEFGCCGTQHARDRERERENESDGAKCESGSRGKLARKGFEALRCAARVPESRATSLELKTPSHACQCLASLPATLMLEQGCTFSKHSRHIYQITQFPLHLPTQILCKSHNCSATETEAAPPTAQANCRSMLPSTKLSQPAARSNKLPMIPTSVRDEERRASVKWSGCETGSSERLTKSTSDDEVGRSKEESCCNLVCRVESYEECLR